MLVALAQLRDGAGKKNRGVLHLAPGLKVGSAPRRAANPSLIRCTPHQCTIILMDQMCVMYAGGRGATRAARAGRRMEPGGGSLRETAPPAWARAPYQEWGLWCFESGHFGFSVFGLRAIEVKRAGQPRPPLP